MPGVQTADEVDGRRGKVGGLPAFVALHDGKPLGPIAEVIRHRGSTRLEQGLHATYAHGTHG